MYILYIYIYIYISIAILAQGQAFTMIGGDDGDDFEAAVLGELPPAVLVARANRAKGQARRRQNEVAGAASRLRAEAPFLHNRHETTDLSRDDALQWLHCCFGRGSASLMDADLCSKAALCSSLSTRRAQLVVAEALHAGMERELRDVVSKLQAPHLAHNTRVVTLKRLWDETALRVQMADAAMRQLLGADFTDLVRTSKGNSIIPADGPPTLGPSSGTGLRAGVTSQIAAGHFRTEHLGWFGFNAACLEHRRAAQAVVDSSRAGIVQLSRRPRCQ